MRSAKLDRCGDRYAPVRMPWASRIAAAMRTVELLPLVPTTWIERNACCGLPRAVSRRRIRSSPNFMPKSSTERRWSSACSSVQVNDPPAGSRRGARSFERVQVRLQPRELVSLGLDDRRRGLGGEAFVGELALRALDLCVEAGPLGGGALRLGLGVDRVAGQDRHVAARDGDGGGRRGA